eukprot:scaffold56943_cov19-Tisochrysis_lutea.AAC.1
MRARYIPEGHPSEAGKEKKNSQSPVDKFGGARPFLHTTLEIIAVQMLIRSWSSLDALCAATALGPSAGFAAIVSDPEPRRSFMKQYGHQDTLRLSLMHSVQWLHQISWQDALSFDQDACIPVSCIQ